VRYPIQHEARDSGKIGYQKILADDDTIWSKPDKGDFERAERVVAYIKKKKDKHFSFPLGCSILTDLFRRWTRKSIQTMLSCIVNEVSYYIRS
jgi:hypothetical protein